MEPLALATEAREGTGKGEARRLRARGLVPGVFYGNRTEAVSVAIAPKALGQALSSPQRRNVLLQLEIAGQQHLAMIKDLQVHPVSRALLHVDLYKVELDQKVRTLVPFLTEGRAKGVVAGGELNVIYRDLPVRTTPDKIPAEIKVDVTNMALGDLIRTKDLRLPEGVEVTFDPERSLITCAEPRKRPLDEEEGAPGAAAAAETPAAAS